MSKDAFNISNLKDAISGADTHKDKKGISNLFQVLDVYEPSAAFEAAPDVVINSTALEYTVEAQEEDSLYEALFAMTALMDDLARLRRETAELWIRYEGGSLDVAAASTATNTAIELARSFEEDVMPLVQENGGSSEFNVRYFNAVCEVMGIDREAKGRPEDDYNFAAYDIADTLLFNTMNLITAFVNANSGGKENYNGIFGWYDEGSRQVPGSGRRQYAQMKPALLEMLSDLQVVSEMKGAVEDQLMYGMTTTLRAAIGKKKEMPEVPLWFAFASQIYLDTLRIVTVVACGPDSMLKYINPDIAGREGMDRHATRHAGCQVLCERLTDFLLGKGKGDQTIASVERRNGSCRCTSNINRNAL